MEKYLSEFMTYFNKKEKDTCVNFAMEGIKKNSFNIPDLYEKILRPALYSIDKCDSKDNDCIWKEHVKTSIVRTIIESLYPHIIELKKDIKPLDIKVVLACPEREYHEIGLRMMSDFFILNGYESIFIGSNTPREQIAVAISQENPKYAAISVTDYFLLFETKKLVANIRKTSTKNIKIILGGNAFKKNLHSFELIDGDIYMKNYEDVENLRKEDLNEISI